jgi:RHS repeat-associated protein
VRKFSSTGAASTVIFVYDQGGQILGEYDSTGKAIREYVWMDSTPVAVFTPDPAAPAGNPLVYTIHTDHLDAPRVVVDKNGAIRWRWLAEPFGTTAPETNPSNTGAFALHLRFPGQYFDQESGLHYNYFRDYDPSIGRYVQSDPIGLKGGINTYTYALNQPARYVDPDGQNPALAGLCFIPAVGWVSCAAAAGGAVIVGGAWWLIQSAMPKPGASSGSSSGTTKEKCPEECPLFDAKMIVGSPGTVEIGSEGNVSVGVEVWCRYRCPSDGHIIEISHPIPAFLSDSFLNGRQTPRNWCPAKAIR